MKTELMAQQQQALIRYFVREQVEQIEQIDASKFAFVSKYLCQG
jgi:hypothetical protein